MKPSDRPEGMSPGSGEEIDAWLHQALRHAPDTGAAPPAALAAAILAEARASVAGRGMAPPRLADRPMARFWSWLARPPVAAGFAGVMAATLIGLMWWDRPLDATTPLPATSIATPANGQGPESRTPAPLAESETHARSSADAEPRGAANVKPSAEPVTRAKARAEQGVVAGVRPTRNADADASAEAETAAPRPAPAAPAEPRARREPARSSATAATTPPATGLDRTAAAPLSPLIDAPDIATPQTSERRPAQDARRDADLRSWLRRAEAATAGRWQRLAESAALAETDAMASDATAANPSALVLRPDGRDSAVITVEPRGLALRLQPGSGPVEHWFADLPRAAAKRLAETLPVPSR